MNNSFIEIYRSPEGDVQLNVKLENNTVWLNRQQMADLFNRDVKTIGKHINNALQEELAGEPVVAKFATTRNYGRIAGASQVLNIEYYSLEMITSVGFRVKSKQGIQFRKWANKILKEYLIKGYAINKDLKIERYNELKEVVRLMARTISLQSAVTGDEYNGLFNVIGDYVYALDILDGYDYRSLSIEKTTREEPFRATYENAMLAINALKGKFGGSRWFANEKDGSFKSSIGQIYQTFDGVELYPSVEEKAAMLLYLVVKNHSFSDATNALRQCFSFGLWKRTAYCMETAAKNVLQTILLLPSPL